jgi:SAM-dependent methyltransferase
MAMAEQMCADIERASKQRTQECPVCLSPLARHFECIDEKVYWRCRNCRATFVDARHLPEQAVELSHYRLHHNDPDDPAYLRFLGRLAGPLLERLGPGSDGLDYGCGPGPALARTLTEAGHRVKLYDPFFRPDISALRRSYDFITCTEVAEHFHRPAAEFEAFNRLLRPGGWLGVMTCFQTDDERFKDWHYRRDPTHVVFYREETIRHLAAHFAWDCEIPAPNVTLMHKRSV